MSNQDPNPPPNPNQPNGPGAGGPVPPQQPGQQPGQQSPYGQQPGQQGQPGQPGQQPPYGQHQPYGGAPSGDIDVMESFKYGWSKFTGNAGVILGGVIAYIVAIVAIAGIFLAIVIAVASTGSSAAAGLGFLGTALVIAVVLILGVFMQAGLANVALGIARGQQVSFASFYKFPHQGKVLLTALLIGVASGLGAFIAVGSIIVGFFAQFALLYSIDKGLAPIDAIKASINLITKNLTPSILLFVGVYVVTAIGALLCGLGLFVAFPVTILATTHVYLRLSGETAAA